MLTNKLQERGGAIQEGKVHNSEERIKELEAPVSRLDNDVKKNFEQQELHSEHDPPVAIHTQDTRKMFLQEQ